MNLSVIEKPRLGQPCNHCGRCCQESLCHAAEMLLGHDQAAPCPFLLATDRGHLCNLVLQEARSPLPKLLAHTLGIGCGCSMDDDDTTDEDRAAFSAHETRWDTLNRPGKAHP